MGGRLLGVLAGERLGEGTAASAVESAGVGARSGSWNSEKYDPELFLRPHVAGGKEMLFALSFFFFDSFPFPPPLPSPIDDAVDAPSGK